MILVGEALNRLAKFHPRLAKRLPDIDIRDTVDLPILRKAAQVLLAELDPELTPPMPAKKPEPDSVPDFF